MALTIAGSDSGGGAGVQADLRTFAALGVYGTCAVTALTAQNTLGVHRVEAVAAEMVAAQIDAVLDDIGCHAAKTGMLATAEIVEAVAERLAAHGVRQLVVDPVLASSSGHELLSRSAREALVARLLPWAEVVTPNLSEAETLTGRPVGSLSEMIEAARRIAALGPGAVIVTGGHLCGDAADVLYLADTDEVRVLPGKRIATEDTHGTGCTFSAALAALLARGEGVVAAAEQAKRFVALSLERALRLGAGPGPVNQTAAGKLIEESNT